MERIIRCIGTVVASLALLVTTISVNSGCKIFAYQSKVPKGAEKLRKFP